MDVHANSVLLATGSADSTVRVFDLNHGHCTHLFKGHGGLVTSVKFHPQQLVLFTAAEDGVIRAWSLETRAYVFFSIYGTHL
jgi:U3 small nucleolar RNA-associated protein 13